MNKQNGVTIIGLIVWVIAIIFIATLVMKVAPVYYENNIIKNAIRGAVQDLKMQNINSPVTYQKMLQDMFEKRLQINNIYNIDAKKMHIELSGNEYYATMQYEIEKPLIANIGLIFRFNIKERMDIRR